MKLCNLPYGLRITAKEGENLDRYPCAKFGVNLLGRFRKEGFCGRKDDGRKTDALATTVQSELKRK